MKIDDAFILGILALNMNKRKIKSGFQPKNKIPKEEITKHPPKGGSAQQRL